MKKYIPEDLINSIVSTQEIYCDKCDDIGQAGEVDDEYATIYFFDEGWRNTGTNIYCPKCVKKYLKDSKSKVTVSQDKMGKIEIKKGKKIIGKQG